MVKLHENYKPEFESIKELLIEMAQERSLDSLLELIVRQFAERPHLALARIWLIRPGDACDSCGMSSKCPNPARCLHLVASAGSSIAEKQEDWSRLDGGYSRIPIGAGKIGQIAATGEPVGIRNPAKDSRHLMDPEWIRREEILGFAGQPLVYRGVVLGVLAVFVRVRIPDDRRGGQWVRLVANQAGAAIANARAFDEIERLRQQLEMENAYLRAEVLEAQEFFEIIGQSPALLNLRRQIDLVAPTDAGVLILGESGTGKELAAREIHKRSLRSTRPMIRVNCAAIPRDLYESEFFGHVKGAFTGAVKNRAGRFELADGGTLFLDEVGDIPPDLQSRLLRVLQEGQFERVGDEVTRQVDVRIVAASNRDLQKEISAGRFRQDLYYRLNVFPIEIAPLRDRREDILLLATHFISLAARKLNLPAPQLTGDNIRELQSYDWPGNVRELQNVMERAVITARSDTLRFDLFEKMDAATSVFRVEPDGELPDVIPEAEMKRRERENIQNALERTRWKISGPGGAAELLGVKPTTLASRIKKLGIVKR
jgi:transcriptional regulator with GAF, ATPase, and Fis domain